MYNETEWPTQLLLELKTQCDEMYYEGAETDIPLTDSEYDQLVDELAMRGVNIAGIGSKPPAADAVKLPYFLPSLDKIKPSDTELLERWTRKSPVLEYVLESKLDGVSCLWVCQAGRVTLYTRGNGEFGRDVTRLLQYLKNVKNVQTGTDFAVRGELIMRKDVFAKKYAETAKNPRNLVSGAVNAKTIKPCTWDISFVAYELVSQTRSLCPSVQLKRMNKVLGFEVVQHEFVGEGCLLPGTLGARLNVFKAESPYDMDGLVVIRDSPYSRSPSNPEYAKAFKSSADVTEAEVVQVHWNISRYGLLKPRVEIVPVKTADVLITYATGHNAKFVKEGEIGPGAIIGISRSGDVIPKITSVIKPSETGWQGPSVQCEWNESGVELVCTETGGDKQRIKELTNFFSVIGAKHVSLQTVSKVYEAGFTTVFDIVNATEEKLLTVPGIQAKSAARIVESIQTALSSASIAALLTASGTLGQGFGRIKIQALIDSVPDFLNKEICNSDVAEKIATVAGFSATSAAKLVASRSLALDFLDSINRGDYDNLDEFEESRGPTNVYLFTGFRDATLANELSSLGHKVANSFTKAVTHVVIDNSKPIKPATQAKVDKAVAAGLVVLCRNDLTRSL